MTPRKNSYRLPKDSALVLRTCDADMTSYGGFKWKEKGIVKAEDWDATPKCGNGLHGLLWGQGHGVLLDGRNTSKKWLVLEVKKQLTVDLNGKVKFPECRVVHCGDRDSALAFLFDVRPELQGVVYSTVVSGDFSTSYSSYGGTSISGDYGISTSGYGGTSTSGNGGTSTSDDYGTSTSGDYGTSTSGYGGTSTSGEGGIIQIKWWDGKHYRIAIGYIGENGLLPNVPYILDKDGQFIEKGVEK